MRTEEVYRTYQTWRQQNGRRVENLGSFLQGFSQFGQGKRKGPTESAPATGSRPTYRVTLYRFNAIWGHLGSGLYR